jgi:hypothetical protein
MYVPQAAPPKKGGGAKLLIIIVVIVVVLAGGGGGAFAWYQATRPKPVISITSQYLDGATLVGATSTSLTLKGTDFTASSAISLLLDGSPLLGAPSVTSDSKGGVDATLTVGGSWSVGMHTITAKDASGYATNLGVKVEIVNQGQDKTPGPNGAPTDSASMKIIAIVLAGSSSGTDHLTVTGSANGGTVCGDLDDGQPHTSNGTASGVGYVQTVVYSCSGTYKSGKLDYTEKVTSYKVAFDNGVNCTASVPFTSQHLTGTFSDASAVSGNYTEDSFTFTCGTQSSSSTPNNGTWTGVATGS